MIGPARPPVTEAPRSWLTNDQKKRQVYGDDPYFWEGWESFQAACSGQLEAALRHLTFLLVKPEAIVGRRIAAILDFLSARGFCCVGTWPVRLNRHQARALWRYQINSVPIAHIRALELGVTAGEMFILGLAHALENGEASSAAELLRLSKGSSSAPAPSTLRGQLRLPARMLNFAHAPDEPADVLRELAIVCDSHPPTVGARSRAGQPAGPSATTRSAIELGSMPPEHALEIVTFLECADWLPLWDRIVTAAHLTDTLSTGRPMLILPPA